MRDVVLPLGEHVVHAVAAEDVDVFDPRLREDGVGRVPRPVDAVGGGGVAEVLRRRAVVVVAGVPEAVRPVFDVDPTSLADLSIPGVAPRPPEYGVGRAGPPRHQIPRELVREERAAGGDQEQQEDGRGGGGPGAHRQPLGDEDTRPAPGEGGPARVARPNVAARGGPFKVSPRRPRAMPGTTAPTPTPRRGRSRGPGRGRPGTRGVRGGRGRTGRPG